MKGPFINDNFLLQSGKARELYEKFARDEPILDFHSHLNPRDIAENRRFKDLFEIWLEGDHYKWRAMRSNGVDERLCTGDAPSFDKFMAFSRTVPYTLRNPLYHWTHLELKRYFGIEELLDESTAASIWERANKMLASDELSVHGILKKFRVKALCTTDDPADDLAWHRKIADSGLATRVFPTFRPDKALAVNDPAAWNAWLDRLGRAADIEVRALSDLQGALGRRHQAFHALGCRLSDHGLEHAHAEPCSDHEAAAIFTQARAGKPAAPAEHERFASYLMHFLGRLYAEKGWTMQLHLGAMRNNNTRRMQELGPDTGFDSIGDFPQARALSRYLDRLDREHALPKTIIYNLNPADNYVFGAMLGNFQQGLGPGKIQLGPGWWFLDQKESMEWQLNALSNLGLLSRFVGMITDSRSFMSFPRHEYFRRVLCNLVGRDVESGEIPDDDALAGPMIKNICFHNAAQYLGLSLPE
ncbi:MAG TPA: glucuronate isomerase [bacterium]|nr:glucuronate isomerase [bacterium]